jgi:hypothetical protein
VLAVGCFRTLHGARELLGGTERNDVGAAHDDPP